MAFVNSIPLSSSALRGKCLNNVTPRRPAARFRMAAAEGADVPDMSKRTTLNIILFGTTSAAVLATGAPFVAFFVPVKSGGTGGGVVARDALGNEVKKQAYIDSHFAGSRELVEGLRGDATYLIVNDDKTDLEYYALNAVCTHLGCVVPWNKAANKFICPCHGSQYAPDGMVVRGPAPLPLALERCEEDENGNVVLKSWKETDFRTKGDPWWTF